MSDDENEIEEDEDESELEGTGTFSIRIVDDDDNGVSGVRVTCWYRFPSVPDEEYTDDDGWAEFPIRQPLGKQSSFSVECVAVNDVEVCGDTFFPSDGETFEFTCP
jgi:hypothetical protein